MKREKRGKGENSRGKIPHQRDNKRWVQYVTIDGQRYKRSGRTRQEVEDKITALRAELKNPKRQQVLDLGPTFAELCTAVLAKHEDDGGTHRVYTHALARWCKLLGDDIRKAAITGNVVQAAIDKLAETLAPGTLETYYAVLRVTVGSDHAA